MKEFVLSLPAEVDLDEIWDYSAENWGIRQTERYMPAYVGILNQRRYWTRTAARTLALDLIKRNDPILNRVSTSGQAT